MGGGLVDRVARAGVAAAARRWPADLSEAMRAEWLAELAALDRPGPGGSAYRKLAFAGSLLVSPAVDEPSWRGRASGLGRTASVAAGVTLLAAALINGVRAADALAPLLLAGAVAACAAIGARVRVPAILVGVAVFAFLLAGNRTPVMPFMGVADIGPAVVTWTVLTAVVARRTALLAQAGHRRRAALLAVGGGLVALDVATIAGSLHAADTLGIATGTAPAWFPLALLPGGVAAFGPHFPDGAATFGSLQAVGPAFHASDILLANAAVMAGPLLLCTVAVLTSALRSAPRSAISPALVSLDSPALNAPAFESRAPASKVSGPPAPASKVSGPPAPTAEVSGPPARQDGSGRPALVAGIVAALAGLAACQVLARSGAAADVTLHRMLDNSTGFGFGFAAHPAGRGAVALLAAVLVMRAFTALTPRRG
jgi:hypothetical protein